MNHLHTYLFLEKDGAVVVSIDCPGNIYLMSGNEYSNYCASADFTAVGGKAKIGKNTIHAPKAGKWHLVIDNDDRPESLNVALSISNGRQLFEAFDGVENAERYQEAGKKKPPEDAPKNKGKKGGKDFKKRFQKEILDLVKDMDDAGLTFLIEQAEILIGDQEEEEMNRQVKIWNEKLTGKSKKTPESKRGKTGKGPAAVLDIEQHSENAFILSIGGVRKVLSRLELRSIVAMSHSRIGDAEFSSRLYDWLKTSRNDFLFDLNIKSADHPLWPRLRRFLRTKFKPKT
ncbi:MAG: DUF1883 domain-containing protein [Spirochaetales bacterium]|nr:DUF1883 domain-containing protein [Spirochaetales bacterium]